MHNVQVQSTVSMQSLQPRVKEIQNRYKGKDQQEMQIQIGQLYKDAGVNPLAGCLPTLATLPVWIGLYRYPLHLPHVHRSCFLSAQITDCKANVECFSCTNGVAERFEPVLHDPHSSRFLWLCILSDACMLLCPRIGISNPNSLWIELNQGRQACSDRGQVGYKE